MKRSLPFLFYALLLSLACKGEGISTKIVLTNPGQTDRQDEAFVLTRDGLPPSPDDALLPALRQAGGDYVPAQADDHQERVYLDRLYVGHLRQAVYKSDAVIAVDRYVVFLQSIHVSYFCFHLSSI